MNAPVRLVSIASLGVIAIIFLVGNRQPLPVVLFGRSLPALPVAVWVLAFGAAGFFSGLLLQVLPRLGRPRGSSASEKSVTSAAESEGRQRRERPEIGTRPGWEPTGTPDWDGPASAASPPPDDEWNIEEPPPDAAVDPARLQRPRPERPARPAPGNRSPRPPADDDRDRAFDFPDEADSPPDPNIVDAPYRLIDPPSRSDDSDDATRP